MQKEFDALQSQGTWTLVPNSGDMNVIGVNRCLRLREIVMVVFLDLRPV